MGLTQHVADIATRRKGRAGTRQDDGSYSLVVVDPVDRREEFRHGSIARQRVTPFRLIHRQSHDVFVLLKLKKV